MQHIIKSKIDSKQLIVSDTIDTQGSYNIIEPFIDFETLLELYYANSYHRCAITLKSNILSRIEDTDLDMHLPAGMTPNEFLRSCIIQLELFGNLFVEKSGSNNNFNTYIIPAHEGRLDKDLNVIQYKESRVIKLDAGFHLKYYSPKSRYYGEPDYIAVISKLDIEKTIDEYNRAFFTNSAIPNMAIIFENASPTQEQIDAFRVFFQNNFKGHLNAHKTLVISTGDPASDQSNNARIRLEDLNKINDISFEKFKLMNRDEIISAHKIPPRLMGIITSGQLGGGGELIGQLHQFNEIEVKPKIQMLQNFFNNMGINLTLREIDVTDFKEDATVIQGLVQLGIVSIQEARDVLGWQGNSG